MSTNRRYRLLKDLPQCKAGTIFDKYDETAIDYVALGVTQWDSGKCKHVEVFLLDCHVENNSEWFSEILPEEKSFNKYRGNLKDDHGRIIFEISECGKYIVEEYKGESVGKKDWEILKWNHPRTGGISTMPSMHKNDPAEIHSVKRLSDGEVFTIGDEINVTGKGVKIRAFEISATGRNIEVQFDYGNSLHYQWLYQIQKSPSPSTNIPEDKKPVLFTEDEIRTMIQAIRDGAMGYDTRKFLNGRLHEMIQAKKQSSPIPESKEERIEVTEIKAEGFSDNGNWYKFHIARSPGKEWPTVLKAQVPAIKSAIEWVINEDEGKPGEIAVWAAIKVLEQSDWLCMKRILSAAKQRS